MNGQVSDAISQDVRDLKDKVLQYVEDTLGEELVSRIADGQGHIAESEEDSFKRILGFFRPVLRSLCEKSKECYERVSDHLIAWRQDLKMNEGATRDARDRRTALDTAFLYYGHDETGNLWVCLGRGEPSAHAEAIRDQDGSDPSFTANVLWSMAGRGATHGQDDNDTRSRTNSNQGDLDAQLRPIPHLISGREHTLFTAQSAGGRSL